MGFVCPHRARGAWFGTAKYGPFEASRMTADHDDTHGDAPGTAHDPDAHEGGEADQRVTSPMQAYSKGKILVGFLVLLVGVAVAYVLPTLA
ncbi:hypothetical protein HALDL1_08785 [Halobacterium sp. DL1]|nr:hypothetical protein HALDL1_08785 [Halobacterium sp. DL1]